MIPGIVAGIRRATGTGGGDTGLRVGLAHWWDLEEASGLRADAVGGLALTSSSGVGRFSARNGYGSLAGSPGFLRNANSPDLSSGDFTIAGVFKTTGLNRGFVSRNGVASDRQYNVGIEGGVLFFAVSTDGTSNVAAALVGSGLNDGALHDFIAWRDTASNTLNVQLDGAAVATVTLAGTTTLYNAGDPGFYLHSIGPGWVYDGDSGLDSIGIWTRALSSEERATLRNGGAWRYFSET